MTTTDMLDTYIWVPELGKLVSERVRRVAEVINDYDPGLFIAPIPDGIREANPGKSHALIHENTNGVTYVVRTLSEDEIDENLLVWLWLNDTERNDVLARLDKLDAARKAIELKADIEHREEMKEIGDTILKSPLHTFRHNGKVYR
jgi:hypothetical protein